VVAHVGHSADPDDAFMFWALAHGVVDPRGFDFRWEIEDIATLNRWARDGRLEATALSLHAYPYVQDRYALLAQGASMGNGYGPIVVARRELSLEQLREVEICVPGTSTTAFLVLRLALGDVRFRELPFDRILDEVLEDRAEAGLLIHEGQLTYESAGLVKCLDLGEWWLLDTGLPLPLGVMVARRDLGARLPDLAAAFADSIRAALEHREEAMTYALQFGRGIDADVADRFVSMYVNGWTCDFGEEGRAAVVELLRRAGDIGALPAPPRLDVVG